MNQLVTRLSDIGRGEIGTVGGKAANLGEIIRMGLPAPRGFVFTTADYDMFKERTGVLDEISPYVNKLQHEPDSNWEEISQSIRYVIVAQEMPAEIKIFGSEMYEKLCESYNCQNMAVAVRSSGVAEDSAELSFTD